MLASLRRKTLARLWRLLTPGSISEVDFVEIHLQNLFFSVFTFIFDGQEAFIDLPLNGFFIGKKFIFDQLLSDGRSPLDHFQFAHVLDQSSGYTAQVDPPMFIKTGVFNGYHGILQEDGNLIDGGPISFFGQKPAYETRLVVKDFDRNITGRKDRIHDNILLGLNRRAKGEEKEKSYGGKNPY